MSTAAATGYLKLDINGFQEAISSAKRLLGGLAAAFGAFKVAQYFKNGISDAITFGHEIHQASMRMGKMDPGNLLIAQKVLERMGLGSEEARAQLEQLVETGRPLATMFKNADDYAKALSVAKQDYGSQAAILSKSAKDFNAVFYTIKAIGEKTRTLFLAATSGFVKPLQTVLNMMKTSNFSEQAEAFGKKIGDAMVFLTNLFRQGKLWEYVKTGMQNAFNASIEYLKGGVVSVFDYMLGVFADLAKPLIDGIAVVSDVLTDIIINTVVGFGKAWLVLYDGIGKVVDYLSDGFDYVLKMAGKAFDYLLKMAQNILSTINNAITALAEGIWNAVSNLGSMVVKFWEAAIGFGVRLADGALQAISDIGRWLSEAFTNSVEFLQKALDNIFSNDWFSLIGNRFKALFSGFGSLIAESMGAESVAEEYRLAALKYDELANTNLEGVKKDIASFFGNFSKGKGSGSGGGSGSDDGTVGTKSFLSIWSKSSSELADAVNKTADIVNAAGFGTSANGEDVPEGLRSSLGAGPGPASVIADSLASIGGGGGFIQSSLSPEAKEQMKANQQLKVIGDQQKETNEILKGMGSNSPTDKKLLMKK